MATDQLPGSHLGVQEVEVVDNISLLPTPISSLLLLQGSPSKQRTAWQSGGQVADCRPSKLGPPTHRGAPLAAGAGTLS